MLALIAGRGRLPSVLCDALNDPPVIAALEGFAPADLTPDLTFRIETLGSFIAELKARGVSHVCFAGGVGRPPLDPARVDAATLPLVPRMISALQSGDDAALRIVLAFFEEAGLTIRAAQEILPDILPKAGSLAGRSLTRDDDEEAIRAHATVRAMGAVDIGQSCVVRHGQVLAVEGQFGTDWMLESLVNRPDDGGGILFKAPKPEQDRRIDLPAIGPDTVDLAARAGLEGIVIEEGGVMVLDRADTIARAEAQDVYLWVRKP
jgi:DUF1009 family protein